MVHSTIVQLVKLQFSKLRYASNSTDKLQSAASARVKLGYTSNSISKLQCYCASLCMKQLYTSNNTYLMHLVQCS